MKIFSNTLYLIFSVILISSLSLSCTRYHDISKKEEALLIQEYQSLEIPLDSIKILDNLLQYYENKYCIEKAQEWPVAFLDMKEKKLVNKANRNTITIGLEPTPCIQGRIEYDDKMILEIIKDGYNTEIEQIFTEIDSIPSFVEKQLLSWGEDPNYAIGAFGNGIWICTKKEDNFENLNPYIYNSVMGFINSVRKYSKIIYGKSIDDLSEEEYKEIAEEFIFHLSFKYTNEEATINFGY